jgi:dTDP-4-dehydrorhamnose reductase
MAVTEVHINGSSDDQIRWFREVWDIALSLREERVDVRAVTAWSLLGSYGWSNLLTVPHGHYEVGAFDLRNGSPESTVFADFLRDLAVNPQASHGALSEKGWWQQESRCFYNVDPFCQDVVEPITGQV